MSGKVVPASGAISLKTAPASAGNAIFEVFGTPAGGNLVGLVGSNVDPGTRPPPFTAAATVPTAASGNLKMSFFAGKAAFLTSPNVPAISTLTTTSFTPTLAGGSGTTYRIAVGTTSGASNTVGWQAATSGTAIAATFAVNTPYFISVHGSNATNASSLAVSNASSFIIPSAPTFGATYGILNTTFTAVATSITSGAVISYAISPSSGVTQASTGVFTGLSQNTQYTVTAIARMSNAGAGYSSNSTAGTTVYCLSPPTFGGFSMNTIRSTITIAISTSANSTGAIISNISGSSTTRTSRITSYSWERSSSTTGSTFLSNTFVSYSVAVTAPNSIYYGSNVNFIVLNDGGTLAVTLPAATFSYQLVGGTGGTGVNASGVFGSEGGYGSYIAGTSILSAGAALLLYAGRNGISGSGTSNTATVNSGDGTKGGNGGYGAGTPTYSTANGGSSGGGGSASQIMCVASNYIVIAGGGGGGGGGGAQGGQGGAGGAIFISRSTGAIGGQGNSFSNNLYDSGKGGGYYGGYGGGLASGGSSGSALVGNYAAGEAGNASGFPLSIINSTWGKGGNGSFYFGTMGAGGGGGWGGGGAGVARNFDGSIDSGGGGGGGSYASDATGVFSTTFNPYIAIVCYS